MKKILAILMSAVLLLGLLAGCGTKTPDATEDTQPVATPVAAGMLVLNVNGALNISYDSDGLVLNVEGADENGSAIAGEYTDYLGKSCSDVVCDLIANSKLAGFLINESHYAVIKLAVGSALPGATFLETITMNAEAAIANAELTAQLIVLTEENLDEDGYIDLESAKKLLVASQGLESFDTLDGTVTPINGMYGFSMTAGSLDADFIVDAVTGVVVEGQLEGHDYDDDLIEDDTELLEPTDEAFIEDTTVPAPVEDQTVPETSEEATPAEEGV